MSASASANERVRGSDRNATLTAQMSRTSQSPSPAPRSARSPPIGRKISATSVSLHVASLTWQSSLVRFRGRGPTLNQPFLLTHYVLEAHRQALCARGLDDCAHTPGSGRCCSLASTQTARARTRSPSG